jgi:hypothetical protein
MPFTFLGKSYRTSPRTTPLSHPALKDLGFWRDLPNQLHQRPIWPAASKPTVTIHTDASKTAYAATFTLGEQEAGARGLYECWGYWEGSHLGKAHITLLDLATVRLCPNDVLHHCVLRRDAVIKLYTENIVTMFVVNKWASKSPLIMAELRRLYQFCQRHGLELELHHLPSALNLYADRLSRRRRVADYLPSLDGVPEHWWVGDSEHDLKLDWIKVDLLRPPLKILPLIPGKAHQDCFKGLMLVPCSPRQNWYQELMSWDTARATRCPTFSRKGSAGEQP